MLLSTNTAIFDKNVGAKRGIELAAKAGFDAVDISLHRLMDKDGQAFNSGRYRDEAEEYKKLVSGCGLVVNQTHTVYPTSYNDDEKTAAAVMRVKRGIEISSILGAKTVVVHPMQHLPYIKGNNSEILREINKKFFADLASLAEQYDVTLCIENMWQRNKISGSIVHSTCADPRELAAYVDMANSKNFAACLDVGHCCLVGVDPADAVHTLGHGRLKALHLHDNDGREDMHVLPLTEGTGKVDWDALLKALADIGYEGDFTYEVNNSFVSALMQDENVLLEKLKYAVAVGRNMIAKFEQYKKEY